ncbi:ubiquinone/menaquinone biosynthesis C-methylase UbiE [Clostridium acetobutylicum]|nr:class I SAM-dependent methyltransferase [Clostridium acetobutylicum]NSA92481.1 ubiquinone/menaquinone biosynthesis C-methylase UbiE [Clostridium acetobutylicum]
MDMMTIQFVDYNGVKFPFENNVFDYVVTRYALHITFPILIELLKR